MTDPSVAALTDFPHSIGKPATRALVGAGITRVEELTTRSDTELLALHGVGPKAIRILGEELASRGRAFADG
ncbi:hypothetical protein ART_0838 [Arthrobacter sp. PAMC 25486]|uniref:hypothetical protein n=1 Tax=Arthrobacter sp. PAMC 25486 TaxID=1494608 RepID=UPI0005363AF7|nr:hypothetical protein [Arthrobacter sp. PAMC 25486]AIY00437.1 hypothetical protein ART_0838 [Arthrobacter sp. PAMC 25486]